jgi:hypothetical protein
MGRPPGYSGKPLATKLGIAPGMAIVALNAPSHYQQLLNPLPAGVRISTRLPRAAAFIHYFATERRRLAARFETLARVLTPAGSLWISWPKGTSGVATDLSENVIRAIGLAHGLVDVKVCAVDETWSGLKFVRRLKDR